MSGLCRSLLIKFFTACIITNEERAGGLDLSIEYCFVQGETSCSGNYCTGNITLRSPARQFIHLFKHQVNLLQAVVQSRKL